MQILLCLPTSLSGHPCVPTPLRPCLPTSRPPSPPASETPLHPYSPIPLSPYLRASWEAATVENRGPSAKPLSAQAFREVGR